MKAFFAIFLCLVLPLLCRADQQIAEAQKNLKDLGFYYGDSTGEKNTETNDAVRRYQIRNGLSITGELNDETIQALKKAAAAEAAAAAASPSIAAPPRAQPPANNTEAPMTNAEPPDNNVPRQPFSAQPGQPFPPQPGQPSQPGLGQPFPVPPGGNVPEVYDGRAVPPATGSFAGTPYQSAPPEVQRRVVMEAQRILAGIGLYKHPMDGNFGPDLEFSLRAYQARVHLHPTGRLDLETLAALELLPGPRHRFYPPRQVLPPGAQPPVRGEWIRP